MKKKIVQSRDSVEEHRLDWGAQELDQSGDTATLEDGQQSLAMVGEVVQGSDGALGGLEVVAVGDGAHKGGHHLRRVHDGVARGLLLGELVHHHGSLGDHHLILVIQQLDQLRNSPGI